MTAKKAIGVFAFASLLMWTFPIGVLQAFHHNLIPGLENMSSQSKTLWSGGLAVLSVNVVIGIYIVLALREPQVAVAPQPDPAFARRAKARQAELTGNQPRPNSEESISRSEPGEKSNKSD